MIEKPTSQECAPGPTVALFDPSQESWQSVRQDIMNLEEICFPGKGLGEDYLKEKFEDPNSVIVLLKRGEKVLGFSYGTPDENDKSALYIDTTEILPEEQGQGYVVSLVSLLEDEARKRGYAFLTRNAAVENGYADKVAKSYGDRIVETKPDNDSEWGRQRYFKIVL
jgi:hypothetical protein